MYIALRSMKVQTPTGMRMAQPGGAVPEAAGWPNPDLWVKRGYLRKDEPEDNKPAPALEPVPVSASSLEPELPPVAPPMGELETETKIADLCAGHRRSALNDLARDYGIEKPEKYLTKPELAKVVLDAQRAMVE